MPVALTDLAERRTGGRVTVRIGTRDSAPGFQLLVLIYLVNVPQFFR